MKRFLLAIVVAGAGVLSVAILLTLFAVPAFAQANPQAWATFQQDFVNNLPEIRQNPSLLNNMTYLKGHPNLAVFLGKHPLVKQQALNQGAWDSRNQWHDQNWWQQNNPGWAKQHHPEWAGAGDWDDNHRWHDRNWWQQNNPGWVKQHHPEWAMGGEGMERMRHGHDRDHHHDHDRGDRGHDHDRGDRD